MTPERDVFGLVGTVLEGKYRIDAVVGEGGFGVVYRGFHLAFQHDIAVKCLKIPPHLAGEAQVSFVTRFRDEGQHLSRLASAHMSIVRVFDFAIATGRGGAPIPYLVLEWLAGRSLDAVLAERRARGPARFGEREAIDLVRPAVEALAVAHGLGIVHRDVKPANLFVVEGQGATLKVLDFGIAKVMQGGEAPVEGAAQSTTGFGAFSAAHGAPEQFSPKRFGATGPWTDVHALGLLLVELVSGRPALEGQDYGELYLRATGDARPTPRARGAIVSDGFEAICARALALSPAQRFPTARELLVALDATTSDGLAPPTPVARAWTPPAAASGTSVATVTPAPSIVMVQGVPGPRVPPAGHARPASKGRRAAALGAVATLLLLGSGGAWIGWRHVVDAARRSCLSGDASACETACRGADLASCAALGERLLLGDGVARDDKRAVDLLRRACDTGAGAAGCGALGAAYEKGRGGLARDDQRAVELYQRGCDGEDLAACVSLGRASERGAGRLPKDDRRAVALYTRACDGGFLPGCSFLGIAHEKGHGGLAKDSGRAVALYQRACDGGELRGCSGLGFAYERGVGGLVKDPKRAVDLYRRGCDGGDTRGCTNLGWAYENALGGLSKDDKRGVDLYARACEADDVDACVNLGVDYDRGSGGLVKDDRRAVELFRRGCDGGSPVGCHDLGFSYERGAGGLVKDVKHAAELYQRSCDDSWMDGCNSLAVYYEHGEGGVKDEKRAALLFRRACEASDMLACANLGYQLENAKGGQAKDIEHAVELYKRSCDGGSADGCARLGVAYELGKGGLPRDMTRATPLYQRACDGGAALSCNNLGMAYQHGKGVPMDAKRAVDLYKRSCDGGAAFGCANLGAANERGLGGLSVDPKRAAELYKRGCDGGNAWSCDALKRVSPRR